MSINKVVVSGNLTRDPELRMAGTTPVLQMGIAVNDRKKNNETGTWEDVPNFFDVVVWGARGESLSRFLTKGTKIVVSGRLRWSSWQTKEGDKRSKVEIVADDVEFMTPRNADSDGGSARYSAPASPAPSADVLSQDIPF
ncbi:MAG: single-stranded DNA-binding protein [Coriobacteriia bacterium]|nr:single-stranded DNA-binding protein [Coriobacteriia bacterium]